MGKNFVCCWIEEFCKMQKSRDNFFFTYLSRFLLIVRLIRSTLCYLTPSSNDTSFSKAEDSITLVVAYCLQIDLIYRKRVITIVSLVCPRMP